MSLLATSYCSKPLVVGSVLVGLHVFQPIFLSLSLEALAQQVSSIGETIRCYIQLHQFVPTMTYSCVSVRFMITKDLHWMLFVVCSALVEKIVAVLPRMKCPYRIEPHQIQGMDFIHIYPVIQVCHLLRLYFVQFGSIGEGFPPSPREHFRTRNRLPIT